MDVKIIEENENSITFLLSGATTAFANAMRRIMIGDTSTMAIDDVMIVENTSVMYDEILAHRLGLIPIITDLENYVVPEKCDCDSSLGCSKCRASFTLEVEAEDKTLTVFSSEIKPQDPKVKPVNDYIPIVKLAPKQKIRLEAYARLGFGHEHAKWQPVSACAYKYLPHIMIDPKRVSEAIKCAKWCHKDVFIVQGNKLQIKNATNCTLCMECTRHCGKKPPIKVEWDNTSFIFYIESTGSLPIDVLVREALRTIADKADELYSKITSKGGDDS